jgi:hypothetical protein
LRFTWAGRRDLLSLRHRLGGQNVTLLNGCLLAMSMGGCATVTRGMSDQLQILSDPSDARVTTSISNSCVTPCTLQVSRRDEFTVAYELAGYERQEVSSRRNGRCNYTRPEESEANITAVRVRLFASPLQSLSVMRRRIYLPGPLPSKAPCRHWSVCLS